MQVFLQQQCSALNYGECCKIKASPTKTVLQMQTSYLSVTSVLSLHDDEWVWRRLPLPLESSQSNIKDLDNSLMQGKQHIISEMKWKPPFKRHCNCLWAFFYYNTSLHYFVITYFPSHLSGLLDWELFKGMGRMGLIYLHLPNSQPRDWHKVSTP